MKKTDSEKDLFDDDFEIIYEYLDDSDTDFPGEARKRTNTDKSAKDLGASQSLQTKQAKSLAAPKQKSVPNQDTSSKSSSSSSRKPETIKSAAPAKRSAPAKSSAPADEKRQKNRKKRKKTPNLLSPAMNTAKAGGKAIYKIARILLRYGSVLLIAYIIYLTASRLWNGRNAYGDLYLLIKQKNYILGAYTGTACILLLYELLSLFWAFSGPKTREGRRVEKIDTGRGFLFFILIFAGSFLAASFSSMIPQSPSPFQGLSGALNIYGGLKSALLPVCGVGVILCLIRKFITK